MPCTIMFMTDSIGDLLPKARFKEPAEVKIIKTYVQDHYQATPQITVQDKQIVIGVSSAALAGALRMELHELRELCQTKKRLFIRIN